MAIILAYIHNLLTDEPGWSLRSTTLMCPNTHHSGQMSQNIQTEKTKEIQPAMLTEVYGKVSSEMSAYKSVKIVQCY